MTSRDSGRQETRDARPATERSPRTLGAEPPGRFEGRAEGRFTSGLQRIGKKRPAAEPGVSCQWASPMSIEVLRDVLLGCAVINYGLLLWWFLYAEITIYKIGIILFNLVPYVALHI